MERRAARSMSVRLRPALATDRDAIARIWLEGWDSTGIPPAGEHSYALLRERVDVELAGGWQVTVAQGDGAVIGFAALRPDLGKLDQLFVAPDVLGQGVGKALMAYAARAMPHGFMLWTHGDNLRARRFYEALVPLRREDGLHPKHGHPIRTYWFAGAA